MSKKAIPVVYACSGCSNAGQMANVFAARLDRALWAEMGCLAGVAGNVPEQMKNVCQAIKEGRPIWSIDGCACRCAEACLKQRDITPQHALVLTDYGYVSKKHMDVSPVEADRIFMEHVLPALGLDEGL